MIIIGPFVLAQMALGHVQVTGEAMPSKGQPGQGNARDFGKLLTRYLGEDAEPREMQEEQGAEKTWPEPKKQGDSDLTLLSLAAVFAPLAEQTNLVTSGVHLQKTESEVSPERAVAVAEPLAGMEQELSFDGMEPVVIEGVPLTTSSEEPNVLEPGLNTELQQRVEVKWVESSLEDAPVSAGQPVLVQGPNAARVVTPIDQTLQTSLEKLVVPEGLGQVTPIDAQDVQVESSPPSKAVLPQAQLVAETEVEDSMRNPAQELASSELLAVVSEVRPDLKKQTLLESQPLLQELVSDAVDVSWQEVAEIVPEQSTSLVRQLETLEEDMGDVAPLVMDDEVAVEESKSALTTGHQPLKMEEETPINRLPRTQEAQSRERLPQVSSGVALPMHEPGQTPSHAVPEIEAELRAVLDVQDRDNLFPKLVETIETLVQEERSEVRMQLKPDHLGTLEVKLSMERGIMVAEFIVQNQQVREIIASQLPHLQTALQDQGTQMADVSVSIGLGHKGTDGEGQERSKQPYQNRYGKLQKASVATNERAYLGRSIWNQVDVRV